MKLQQGYLPKSIQTQGKPPSACSGSPTNAKGREPLGHLVLGPRTGRLKNSFVTGELSLPTSVAHEYILHVSFPIRYYRVVITVEP